jgi:hypothetical protein
MIKGSQFLKKLPCTWRITESDATSARKTSAQNVMLSHIIPAKHAIKITPRLADTVREN